MSKLSMKRVRKIMISVCCVMTLGTMSAQIYPVQVTPQLIPPYSFKLSDYATTTQEKLFVNLLFTDAREFGRQVRLKMFVEGPGIKFQSVDFVSGALPIVLDGGINQRLTNLDLQPYFNLNNLVGITPRQYGQQLPEGQYRFCFEVYDQFSGQRISNRSCANIFLVLNDPPLLNVPFRGDLVTARDPQNLVFNWTPRHFNAGAVQYEFTLKELWDTGMDPQAAFMASPPLYRTTTFANTLHYGPAQMPLLEGKTYGWQVRAFVSDGITDTSLFRNNGMSEIFHFAYRADCHPPRFVLSQAGNSQTVKISWQMGEHVRYRVQYRKKGHGEGDWFGLWSQGNEATIRNLEAGTVYEFRVGGDCNPLPASLPTAGGSKGEEGGLAYSAIHEFTTPTEEEMAYYNCGIPPEIEINNQEPLLNLGVNEVFRAGDFPIIVKYVDYLRDEGRYTGWGTMTVPYFGDTNIRVEFDNIKINTDYQMVEGMMETSYDAEWSGIVDVDGAIADVGQFVGSIKEIISQIFDRREEELDELQELQDRLAEGSITEEEFNEQAEEKATNIEKLDDLLGEQLKEKILNSPVATEAQKEQVKNLGPTALASKDDLSQTDINNIKTKDAAARKRLEEIAEEVSLAEDEQFYMDASAYLLDNPDFVKGLQLISDFFEYLDNTYKECREDGLKSYQGQGVVPYCLWENSEVIPINYYGYLDPPFMAGLTDGLYQEVEGLVLLPKLLLDLYKAKYDVFYAYTTSYLQCPETLGKLDEERARELYRRMDRQRPDTIFGKVLGFFEGITDYISDYQDQRCEDALKLREEVSDLLEFLKDREQVRELYASIEKEIENYFNGLQGLDNLARYKHGKLTVAVLTFLVPTGATQLSKLGKWKKVLQTIKGFTKSQMDEFLSKFRRFMDDGLVGNAGRNANWVEVLDIRNKILAKKPHVLTVENINTTKTYNGIVYKGFTGCHSEKALQDFIVSNGGTYRIVGKPTKLADDVVFNGQPVITIGGNDYVKTNGAFVEYAPGKFGGTSTFFPKNWDEAKILDEVEYAIANNHGKVPGSNNTYFGFSKDGKVEIQFYINEGSGNILSYFPIKK